MPRTLAEPLSAPRAYRGLLRPGLARQRSARVDAAAKGRRAHVIMTEAARDSGADEQLTYAEAVTILERMALAFTAESVSATAPAVPDSARLEQAELRYRTLVEQIPAVTFMAALDGGPRELYVSPQIETLLGFTQKEWLENPILWFSQLHRDDRERWQQEFAQTCATGVHFCSEYRFLARDGRVVWVHGECQVVRDAQGRALFLQGIAYDITQRMQAEEALRRLHHDLEILVQQRTAALAEANARLAEENRRKDHFLAVLSHELRNPLAPIGTALELLRRPGLKRESSDWAHGMIERQVRHMTRLIDDLVDIARINQDKIVLHKDIIDLATVLMHATEATHPLRAERHHQLSLALPAEPIYLEADGVRLEQVVTNLLTNAAKYTPPGGRIELRAEQEGSEAVLRVRDNGIGIPPEMLERIFDMFMQVDRSLSRSAQWGLGVGLALARRLVELHGGRIQAFSAGPGQGSEFVVRLPLVDQRRPRAGAIPRSGRAAEAGLPGRKVLLVDDHAAFAESTAMLLRAWGHDVRVAGDGPTALAAARSAPPDVILLDISLPEMDGYEVAQQLRESPVFDQTLLVALTGYGRDDDRRRAQEVGFDCHVTKPVEAEVLHELLTYSRGEMHGHHA